MKMTLLKLFIVLFLINLSSSELRKPLDLTWNFENDTIYWRDVRPFSFTKQSAQHIDGYFIAENEFCAGEHGGTHIDAPYHFNENGLRVGEIPFEKLILPGLVIDISDEVEKYGASRNLLKEDLEEWAEEIGRIPKQCVLLVRFGWSKYWPDKKKYFGVDADGIFHFPGISAEAAQWIADQNKFVGVGADVASIDAGDSTEFPAHRTLTGKGLYLIENVNIKEELPAKDFTLFVMPMKILYGTGAPLRIFATPKIRFVKNC